jgi:hypothetical protein
METDIEGYGYVNPMWDEVRKERTQKALELIHESSGRDPSKVRVEDFSTYTVEDIEKAIEMMKSFYQD